MKGLKGHMV